MAIQMTPLAVFALRYGAVAVAGFAAGKYLKRGRFPRAVEHELNVAPEGIRLRRDKGQISGSAKVTRLARIGRFGPKFRVDAAALGRIRIRRLA